MKKYIERGAAILAAVILIQTLFFKFTAHPDSVALFETLGLEPYGRIGIGVAELIVAILLLIPRTSFLGALGGLAIISGAIVSHLTKLGIVYNNDGGALFMMAIAVFICCAIVFFFRLKHFRRIKNAS